MAGFVTKAEILMEEYNRNNNLIKTINNILGEYGISETICLDDVLISGKIVTDAFRYDAKLSDLIVDAIWPRIPAKTVYHYTTREAAENILKSGVFRLTCLEKRWQEDEIIAFCNKYKLEGYLEKDDSGKHKYRDLIMRKAFYASFTDITLSADEENYFWQTFASCDGVRLKIDIEAENYNFKKIYYEKNEKKPLLFSAITERVKKEFDMEFILKGISRICAFYLPSDLGREKEYRILHKDCAEQDIKGEGPNSYIELPLNEMSEKYGFKLSVTEVFAREMIDIPDQSLFVRREN